MEILVLGDGAYVFAVLNAVASITSYNMLGALGAVVAILLMAIKGASGQPVQPGSLLVSVVLFWVVFVPRVDRVVVQEIMVQPGGLPPRSFVVDNVPFGLAAGGFLMSQLGAKITSLNETSFGSADDTARGTTGGLGRNLVLLNAIQSMANDPRFTDAPKDDAGSGYLDRYRHNMGNHLRDCYFPIANNNSLSVRSAMNKPGLTGVVNAATANPAAMTTFLGEDLTPKAVTCAEMNGLIGTSANVTSALESAFDQASKAAGKSVTAKEISLAFSTFTNKQAENVGAMIATSIMRSLVAQAAASGSLSPRDAQSVIMLEEASAKRNVQWAAEESLFIRILRPIVGFFEALFYALAPIMAFVITLGPFGWSLVGKYAMLTVWVALWFPMLAITQLYSNVQVSGFFERMMSARSADGTEFYSPEQLHGISLQAMDALGAASALTAATPALAMSLIFGGAVSMSYLAGRLQGSDMIDEGKVAPNASSVSPIASFGSVGTGTAGAGTVLNGASMPKVSAQEAGRRAEQFGTQATHAQAKEFSSTLAEMAAKNAAVTHGATAMASSGWTNAHNEAYEAAVNKAYEEGAIGKEDVKALTSLDQQQRAEVSVGVMVGGFGGRKAGTDGSSDTEQYGTSAERSAAAKLGQSQSARTGLSLNVASAIQNSTATTSQTGLSASESTTLLNSAKETYQVAESYQKTAEISRTFGRSEELTYSQMGENFERTHGSNTNAKLAELGDQIRAAGLGAELDRNLASYETRGGVGETEHRQLAAMYDTLATANVNGENADELLAAQSMIIQSSFNSPDAATGLSAYSAVSEGRDVGAATGAATASVAGATAGARGVTGAGVSSDAVFGQASAGAARVQADVEAGHSAQPAVPADGALGFNSAQADLAAGGTKDVAEMHGKQAAATKQAAHDLIGDMTRINNGWDTSDPPPSPGGTRSPIDAGRQ